MIEFDLISSRSKSPDMTPMIDMVFLLLIFFLLTSVFRIPAVETDLPGSVTATTVKPEEFIISVKENGDIYFNKNKVGKERLQELVSACLAGRDVRDVTIASDRGVSFDRIIEVMDVAKMAGADSVSFLTEDEKR